MYCSIAVIAVNNLVVVDISSWNCEINRSFLVSFRAMCLLISSLDQCLFASSQLGHELWQTNKQTLACWCKMSLDCWLFVVAVFALILGMQRAQPMQGECTYNNPKLHLIKLDQQSVRDAQPSYRSLYDVWCIPFFSCPARLWQLVFVASLCTFCCGL